MKKRLIWIGVPLILALQGCAALTSIQGRAEKSWETVSLASPAQIGSESNSYLGMEDIGVVVLSEADSSLEEHLDNAWQHLSSNGDYQQARIELGKALFSDAENSDVQSLYSQISTPIEVYAKVQGFDLNAEKIVYLAKQGDSVEQLSERFYGTGAYFPFLMRVNKLSGVALSGGESLWIPAKLGVTNVVNKSVVAQKTNKKKIIEKQASSQIPPQPENEQVNEPENMQVADDSQVSKSTPAEVVLVEPEVETEIEEASSQEALTKEASHDDPNDAIEEGLTSVKDETLLAEAATVDEDSTPDSLIVESEQPINEELEERVVSEEHGSLNKTNKYAPNEEKTPISKEEEKGLSVLRKGDSISAYSLLLSAPNLSEAGTQVLAQLQHELVEQPYANGLAYYQQQKLEPAITEFKRVLKANPNHGQARLYLVRCEKLLERLQTIN